MNKAQKIIKLMEKTVHHLGGGTSEVPDDPTPRSRAATMFSFDSTPGPTIKGIDTSTHRLHVEEFDDVLDENENETK